jgi:hypothetical protein
MLLQVGKSCETLFANVAHVQLHFAGTRVYMHFKLAPIVELLLTFGTTFWIRQIVLFTVTRQRFRIWKSILAPNACVRSFTLKTKVWSRIQTTMQIAHLTVCVFMCSLSDPMRLSPKPHTLQMKGLSPGFVLA